MDGVKGRYGIDLDISASSPRLQVKPANLMLEPGVRRHEMSRAKAENGILEEYHGRAISQLLDFVRYLVGSQVLCAPDMTELSSIHALRSQGYQGLLRLNHLIGMAWSHWRDSGVFQRTEEPPTGGVYGLLNGLINVQIPAMNPLASEDATYQLMQKSVCDRRAVGGWHVRIHGSFWIVDHDGGGAYIIPEANHHVVYKVLGIRNALFPMLQAKIQQDLQTTEENVMMLMIVTMIPVRSLFDSNI